jgi:hypothetical protein
LCVRWRNQWAAQFHWEVSFSFYFFSRSAPDAHMTTQCGWTSHWF